MYRTQLQSQPYPTPLPVQDDNVLTPRMPPVRPGGRPMITAEPTLRSTLDSYEVTEVDFWQLGELLSEVYLTTAH